jgi:hypothetical protein
VIAQRGWTLTGPVPSPQESLAAAIGGTIIGPSTIQVGTRLVVAGVTGVVRVDGVALGMWCDRTPALAQAFAEAVAS